MANCSDTVTPWIQRVTLVGTGPLITVPITFPLSPVAMTQNVSSLVSVAAASAGTVLAANANRKSAVIVNLSAFSVHVSIGGVASVANMQIPAGYVVELNPTTIADLEFGLVSIWNPNAVTAASIGVYEAV